jgi:hypothetical protein
MLAMRATPRTIGTRAHCGIALPFRTSPMRSLPSCRGRRCESRSCDSGDAGLGDLRRPARRRLRLDHASNDEYASAVQPCIDAVKCNCCVEAGHLVEPVVAALLQRGAPRVVLACTELPLALDAIGSALREACVDSTAALARMCAQNWFDSVRLKA